jgi:hypothetical protein
MIDAYNRGIPTTPHISDADPAVLSRHTSIALTTEKIVRTIPTARGIASAKFLKNNFIIFTFDFVSLQLQIEVLQHPIGVVRFPPAILQSQRLRF